MILVDMGSIDLESPNMAPEIAITKSLSRLDTSKEKVMAMKKTQDYVALLNSLWICECIYYFGAVHYRPSELVDRVQSQNT